MDYGDYYWGLYRDLLQGSIPPFPTKHQTDLLGWAVGFHVDPFWTGNQERTLCFLGGGGGGGSVYGRF